MGNTAQLGDHANYIHRHSRQDVLQPSFSKRQGNVFAVSQKPESLVRECLQLQHGCYSVQTIPLSVVAVESIEWLDVQLGGVTEMNRGSVFERVHKDRKLQARHTGQENLMLIPAFPH